MTRPKAKMITLTADQVQIGDHLYFDKAWQPIVKIAHMPATKQVNLIFDANVYSWKSLPVSQFETVTIMRAKSND